MIPRSDVAAVAAAHGAPLCAVTSVAALPDNEHDIGTLMRGARTVVVVAAPHSRHALVSFNLQATQYDTIHAYGEVGRASHAVALWLERKGFGAIAVPAFIPIDMSPPNSGL